MKYFLIANDSELTVKIIFNFEKKLKEDDMDIGIYVTNINTYSAFRNIKSDINRFLPGSIISIDLDDIDRVLRIEAEHVESQKIIKTVNRHHFDCKEMTY